MAEVKLGGVGAKLTVDELKVVSKFINDYRQKLKDKQIADSDNLQLVATIMQLVAQCLSLSNNDKKELVKEVWKEISDDDSNQLKGEYDVSGVINVLWDTYKGRYGFKVKKSSLIARLLPCCIGCSCFYNTKDNKIDIEQAVDDQPPVKLVDINLQTPNVEVNIQPGVAKTE